MLFISRLKNTVFIASVKINKRTNTASQNETTELQSLELPPENSDLPLGQLHQDNLFGQKQKHINRPTDKMQRCVNKTTYVAVEYHLKHVAHDTFIVISKTIAPSLLIKTQVRIMYIMLN